MLVKLDGDKIADEIKLQAENDPELTPEEKVVQERLLGYLYSGLRNSEVWYTVTVNKQNWQTVAMSLNLTGLVQAVAQAVLNDPTQNLGDFEREILETVAFFSETKAYTTFLNQDAAQKLEIPKKALKAEKVDSLIGGTTAGKK